MKGLSFNNYVEVIERWVPGVSRCLCIYCPQTVNAPMTGNPRNLAVSPHSYSRHSGTLFMLPQQWKNGEREGEEVTRSCEKVCQNHASLCLNMLPWGKALHLQWCIIMNTICLTKTLIVNLVAFHLTSFLVVPFFYIVLLELESYCDGHGCYIHDNM